jgi:hypothetical protein
MKKNELFQKEKYLIAGASLKNEQVEPPLF